MSLEKHPKADLESKRTLLLLIGLGVALLLTILAFEWKSYDESEYDLGDYTVDAVEEEIIPITRAIEPPPPPPPVKPPPPPPPPPSFVETDKEVKEEPKFNSEDDQNTKQEDYEQEERAPVNNLPFQVVEQMPAYKGCENKKGEELANCNYTGMYTFFEQNKMYPYFERENDISGTVIVYFVINTDGSIMDVTVKKGISEGLDKEAIRLVKKMPNWTPGKQRGTPVKIFQYLPIKFALD